MDCTRCLTSNDEEFLTQFQLDGVRHAICGDCAREGMKLAIDFVPEELLVAFLLNQQETTDNA